MATNNPFVRPITQVPAARAKSTGQLALESAISSATREMVGLDPPPQVAAFRRDNPWLGLGTQFGGLMVPYGAWTAVARAPRFAAQVGKIGKATERAKPFRTEIKRELARWLPFEAGRVGGAALVGGDIVDTAASAGIDLGLFGGAAGLMAVLRAAGPRAKRYMTPAVGEDIRAPIQHQMRTITDAIGTAKVPPEVLPDLQTRLKDLGRAVRIETPGAKTPFVRDLAMGGDREQLNRIFKPHGKRKSLLTKRFYSSPTPYDFKGEPAWRQMTLDFGLPPDFEQFGQFFRYLEATNAKGRSVLTKTLKGMEEIGDGWKITKEANEGLYVLSRRIGDKAVLFKTDTPGKFVPQARAKWADLVTARSAWLGGVPKPVGAQLYDSLLSFTERVPAINYLDDLMRKGKPREAAERMLGSIGIDLKALADQSQVGALTNFANRYLAPAALQFRSVPRFRWIQNAARFAHDFAEARKELTLFGKLSAGSSGNLFKDLVKSNVLEGGLIPQVKALDQEGLKQLWQIQKQAIGSDVAEAMGMQPQVVQLVRDLEKYDVQMADEIARTQKATGQKILFRPLAGHLGIGRTWKGEHRARVFNENGKLIFVGSGHTPKEALDEADEIVKAAQSNGRDWRRDSAPFLSGRERDLGLTTTVKVKEPDYEQALRWQELFVSKKKLPGFAQMRRKPTGEEIGGFLGQYAPWTKDELAEIITRHVTEQENYLASISSRNLLASDMTKLLGESPEAWNSMVARFRDLEGGQGAFSQSVNAAVDKVLGPALGKNSASKIVANTNKVMFHWTQGMGQIGFNVLNALTFLQTGLGQAAYVMSGGAGKRGWAYSWWATSGRDGLPRAPMGVLDPAKVGWRGIKLMGNPDPEFRKAWGRAASEGVTDPRFAEEFVGQNSQQAMGFKQAFNEGGIVKWIGDVSKWMPSTTEKFARGHAFATGWIIGKDFLNITDNEVLFRFAKEYTQNTMYLYSVSDRARILAGPLGSAFGLWKNWQMNYMGWWMEYSGEAFLRGNWSPLLWSVGGTAATAGVGGLPLYGAADAFARWSTDESLMTHIYDLYHDSMDEGAADLASDVTFMGMPAFFGVSLQGSASGPFADPSRDASMLMTLPYWNRMKAIGQLWGDSWDAWNATGQHPVYSPGVRDQLVAAFAPKTLWRIFSAVEEDYLKSLATGHPRQRDVGFFSKALYSLGLTPVEVERYGAVADELWADKQKMLAAVRAYGQAYFEAHQARDWRGANEVLKRAIASEVDPSRVMRSFTARQARHEQDLLESQFDPQEVLRRFKNVLPQ